MHILVVNAGSSSHRLAIFHIDSDAPVDPLWEIKLDWDQEPKDHVRDKVVNTIKQAAHRYPIACIGHRVVNGGHFQEPVLIDAEVKGAIKRLIPLAPLHNPANLEGIEWMEALFPGKPQIAVFDTSFHLTMPEAVQTYAVPYSWKEAGIQRYGFHGISYQYCTARVAQLVEKDLKDLRIVCCHLGNGASLCAIKDGVSINTTMGFTPMEGLMMGSRCGSIDPGLILYMLRDRGLSVQELDRLLNFESGLKGIAGESDMRDIVLGCQTGSAEAQLAFDMFINRLRSFIGALIMQLEGLDLLIFTAGIGEHSAEVRRATCQGLSFLGIELDEAKNKSCKPDQDISISGSSVKILVIHTREEWMIAKESAKILSKRS